MNFTVPNSFELAKLQCNDLTSRALSYLLKRPEENVPMTECIYRVQANILEAGPEGVLLKSVLGNTAMLAAEETALPTLLEKVPGEISALLVCSQTNNSLLTADFSHCEELTVWQWPSYEPPKAAPFEVWPLDEGDVDAALVCGLSPERQEEFLRVIGRRSAFGACVNDEVAGIGSFDELGSMAWLGVQPALRGQGIGMGLLRWLIRAEQRKGHIPFALIPIEDKVGLSMAEQVGLSRCQGIAIFLKR